MKKGFVTVISLIAACNTAPNGGERSSAPQRLAAGETARGLGIVGYDVVEKGKVLQIEVRGNAEISLGRFEIEPTGETRQVEDVVEPLTALRFTPPGRPSASERKVGKLIYFGSAGSVWPASLTDAVLEPLFAERGLTFKVWDGPPITGREVPFTGEYPCCGHRVNDAYGIPYTGCGGGCDDQVLNWSLGYPYPGNCAIQAPGVFRHCDPGCCNSDCANPSPTGASLYCSGYGGAGCQSPTPFDWYDCQNMGCECNDECYSCW